MRNSQRINDLLYYKTPATLLYYWNFGSLAIFCLLVQIGTGLLLAMWYVPHVDFAFSSIEYIMREVWYGWLVRYIHTNGASLFFAVVYFHILRGFFYNSFVYPREFLWYSGIALLLAMIFTAFLGYVLPWGQMSYWAATVITSLVSVIPYLGDSLLLFLWGDYGIGQATLTRIYAFHFLMPFVLVGLTGFHLLLLHNQGSTNPLGQEANDKVPFHFYYTVKDIFGILVGLAGFIVFCMFYPNTMGHPDNYIEADRDVTPVHIVPEWYLLPFYALLRSVPNKFGGIVVVVAALLVLTLLPAFMRVQIRFNGLRLGHQIIFVSLVFILLILGWAGQNPVESPYHEIRQYGTVAYSILMLLMLLLTSVTNYLIVSEQGYGDELGKLASGRSHNEKPRESVRN